MGQVQIHVADGAPLLPGGERAGTEFHGGPFLLGGHGDGHPREPRHAGEAVAGDRAGLGAKGYCLHELRHSYLTALARASMYPKVMQVLAGHAVCAVTKDILTHVNMDPKREAAETLRQSMARFRQHRRTRSPRSPESRPRHSDGITAPDDPSPSGAFLLSKHHRKTHGDTLKWHV